MPYCTRLGQSAALAQEMHKEKNSWKVELFGNLHQFAELAGFLFENYVASWGVTSVFN